MKTLTLTAILAMVITSVVPVGADILYLTAYTSTIRKSADSGVTWADWVTGGSNYRAIAMDPTGSVVFCQDRFGGTLTATEIRAFDAAGTLLDTTTYDRTGEGSECALGFNTGRMYVNHGQAGGSSSQRTGFSGFSSGSYVNKPVINAQAGDWQGNDMAFAAASGQTYAYINGSGNSAIRRWDVNTGAGTWSNPTTLSLSGTSAATDLAFTPNGRLIVINSSGIWLSGTGQVGQDSVSLSQVFTFTGTENPSTGDMGNGARDFVLINNKLYAVNSTRVYVYTVDDAAGTVSFVSGSAALHGYNSSNVQITGTIPEPAAFGLLALAGLAARRFMA